jgi:1-acyl-sn-glycerol-3-phosphate acyltransferase
MNRIPKTGPALIIAHHGLSPMDIVFFKASLFLDGGRDSYMVCDRFVFKIYGMRLTMHEAYRATTGTINGLIDLLNKGSLVIILPGGAREGFFSRSYETIWNNRMGFIKVAKAAKVSIIPIITTNNRDMHIQFHPFYDTCRRFYDKTKIFFPLLAFYFPVRMRTFVGEAIPFNEQETDEELMIKTKQSIENLINKYQQLPGNFVHGLKQRFTSQLEVENNKNKKDFD